MSKHLHLFVYVISENFGFVREISPINQTKISEISKFGTKMSGEKYEIKKIDDVVNAIGKKYIFFSIFIASFTADICIKLRRWS